MNENFNILKKWKIDEYYYISIELHDTKEKIIYKYNLDKNFIARFVSTFKRGKYINLNLELDDRDLNIIKELKLGENKNMFKILKDWKFNEKNDDGEKIKYHCFSVEVNGFEKRYYKFSETDEFYYISENVIRYKPITENGEWKQLSVDLDEIDNEAIKFIEFALAEQEMEEEYDYEELDYSKF